MRLVINIPEEFYQNSCETGFLCWEWMSMLELTNAIKNGTPLPKGHGRLIDADAFRQNIDRCPPFIKYNQDRNIILNYAKGELLIFLTKEPTIIEADKETDNG